MCVIGIGGHSLLDIQLIAETSPAYAVHALHARSLGTTRSQTLFRVHIFLLRPPVLAALLLVFVDVMKELPATLVLRPFDFDTLATLVYMRASLGQVEEAALPALMIILVGLVPVVITLMLLDTQRR